MDTTEDNRFQILSLSGGGIMGVYTAQVLMDLEEHLCKDEPLTDHFDMICGTSIGGILALGLAYGIRPKILLELLTTHGNEIFPKRSIVSRITKQLFSTLYSQDPLKKLLDKVFGNATIKDLKIPVIIPAIDSSNGKPKAFKNKFLPEFTFDQDVKLVDVALATSAAPTFFPVHQIQNTRYVDGGLVANSPVLMGVHEAIYRLHHNPENIHALSVGTMSTEFTLSHKKNRFGGYLFSWAFGKNLIKLTMSANEIMHSFMARHILGDKFIEINEKSKPEQASILDLDNASPEAIEMLSSSGHSSAASASGQNTVKKMFTHTADHSILSKGEM